MVFSAVQVCLTSYIVTFLTGDLRWTLVAAGVALGRGAGRRRRRPRRSGASSPIAAAMRARCWSRWPPRWRCAASPSACWRPAIAARWVIGVLVVYGATAIGWNGVFLATVARLVPPQQAATATSGSLFFTYFGVVVGPPLFGAVAAGAGRLGIGFLLLALPLLWAGASLWRARWRSHD